MKQFFAYIRVSTAKQGEKGVSLQEQRDAIARFAERQNLAIVSWFEERETAAKRGRPIFTKMMGQLKHGAAAGVIIHKIDRSARNLKDWADLGELIDSGIEVHFANESLDMHSRGGRLTADIQAVVAADYIRNLREETKKGFYGRLKQGIYPLGAPVGYLNMGKGKPKAIDPVLGPVVKSAFALYATGRYSLDALREVLRPLGLRNRKGGKWSINGISVMLKNPFYIGIIRLRKTGESFQGIHEPLVSKHVFDRVQDVLAGKLCIRRDAHEFLYRRLFQCATCGLALIGERQKGHVYYRCHTPGCTSVREESLEAGILKELKKLVFSDEEKKEMAEAIESFATDWANERKERQSALDLRAAKLKDRLSRLTDAFIDGSLEKELFEERKSSLLMERKEIDEAEARLHGSDANVVKEVKEKLELAGSAYLLYQTANADEKRELLQIVTSNRQADAKNVAITMAEPFQTIANRTSFTSGGLRRDTLRTVRHTISSVLEFWKSVETRRTG